MTEAIEVKPTTYPHPACCVGCRSDRRCNHCGKHDSEIRYHVHPFCTNGRCPRCHETKCTPGGATSPGHGGGWASRTEYEAAYKRAKRAHGRTA